MYLRPQTTQHIMPAFFVADFYADDMNILTTDSK